MEKDNDKTEAKQKAAPEEKRKRELDLLALKDMRIKKLQMKRKQGAIIMPWDFGDMEKPEEPATPEELRYQFNSATNQIEKEFGLSHPGRKQKTDEERQKAANMAHELYMNGDKTKYSHTGGKNAVANIVAKRVNSTSRTVLRDWKQIYPDDFSK